MKEDSLKRVLTVWFQLYNIHQKAKLSWQCRDHRLPGAGEREESGAVSVTLGQWNYSVWCCHGAHMTYCCSVAQSCPALCDPMDCGTPGLPVLHCLPELAHTHVHWVSDTIQPSSLYTWCIYFSKPVQLYNTNSEYQYKSQTLVNNSVSVLVHSF